MTMGGRVDMKVVMLGREAGGKTSLVQRYLYDRFSGNLPYQATIGAAFGAKTVNVNGKLLTMGIWDTAGSERYEAMSRIYYRGACAAIICYDLTDDQSLEKAQFWVNELKQNEENCKIYLCGTKKDLVTGDNRNRRRVDYFSVTDYATEIGAEVYETSSKTGEQVSKYS
ncbi:hypothetical protein NP493_79g02025 [Ridgeia piscesae]|uniref:Ras-related protein Rab-24 n=1 Tax=Ridgeia piscesae TaxID=27915 RepID=A0AAD9P8U7_RIDPI|nr:hypothetical protein NP493_8456g00003 [Ridgeia piscesae]KAK2190280.1 hypothetical protein NP493_79g02025 [Ridgeia piscesae]